MTRRPAASCAPPSGAAHPIRCRRPRARRRSARPPRRALRALRLTVAAAACLAPLRLAAQAAPKSPEVVAQEFLDGFRSSAWRATAQRLDAEALERFRGVVTMMTRIPEGARFREVVLGGADSAAYEAMDDERVFAETAAGVFARMPGLLHALAVKDVEVVGAIRGASGDTAWAVYRSLAALSGAETETRVMTLVRRDGRWGVSRAPEMEVLLTALRGLPLGPDDAAAGRPQSPASEGGGSSFARKPPGALASRAWSRRPCRSASVRSSRSEPKAAGALWRASPERK